MRSFGRKGAVQRVEGTLGTRRLGFVKLQACALPCQITDVGAARIGGITVGIEIFNVTLRS